MTIDEDVRRRMADVADAIDEEHAVGRSNRPYLDRREEGGWEPTAPVLHLEDVTGIPFVSEITGVEEYQHRARVRADDGDIFAAVTDAPDGYEAYNREVLGLGRPDLLVADPVDGPMAVARACREGEVYEQIRAYGRRKGRLVIHPYMAIEPVWQLAERLVDDGVEATVLGPPPPVLWVANDKARIAEINDRLFEQPWNVATEIEREPEAMARQLLELAERFERVGLKRTRCASAMGNLVIDSEAVLEAGPRGVLRRVHRFLNRTEWEEGEEVLVVEWFDASHSPSTQTWIPPEGEGQPRMDGVYEQLLKSEEKIFVGSRPSTLPEPVNRSIAEASLAVGGVLQQLGYVGRCSFDFIVGGDIDGEFDARMIECNGRWGGTSTPMHLVDRVVDGPRPAYIAKDVVHPDLIGAEFSEIRRATEEHLYRPETGEGSFIFYNPGPLAQTGKIDVVAVGREPTEAEERMEVLLPELLGI